MLGLICDAASVERLFIICKDDRHIATFQTLSLKNSHTFFFDLEKFLTSYGYTLEDFSWFAYGHGPGSFTGIRIAQVGMQSLCFQKEKNVFSFSSFLPYYPKTVFEENSYILLDAGEGGAYVAKLFAKFPYVEEAKKISTKNLPGFIENAATIFSPDHAIKEKKTCYKMVIFSPINPLVICKHLSYSAKLLQTVPQEPQYLNVIE